MRKLKILYFLNSLERGGVEEHLLALVRRLERRHFEVVVVCPRELNRQLAADLPSDVRVVELGLFNWKDIRAVAAFLKVVRKERPDIIHSHMFNASMFGSALGRICGVPVSMETCHGPESWRTGWIKRSYMIDRVFSRFVDHFIAVSDAAGRHLVSRKGVPEKRITVIRNGRELSLYSAGGRCDFMPDTGNMLKVGVVGRLDEQKGHRYLIEAASRLIPVFSEVSFVFLGDGNLRAELEGLSRSRGVEGHVHFIGYHKDVPAFLQNIDIFVLPSLYEGLPLAAIEASAAGLPIVATAVDGTPEVVLDGKTGLLVPPRDPVALCDAILRLCRDPGLREELSRNARERARGEFSIERQMSATERLYMRMFPAGEGR